jgi:uncharacterized protein YndB with AHSA1/START domain
MQFDVPRQLGAVTRLVTDRTIEGRPARVVIASRTYDTTADDVWDAITSPTRIPRWFLPITGELRLGGRYQLEGNAGGEITTCEPPRRLGVTWEMRGDVSWVEVRLTEAQGRTELVLEHVAHVPEEFWGQFGPGAVGIGWELGLLGLHMHLETGADKPADEAAFAASDEGKAIIRGSADGWCRAAIAGGDPEEAARAASTRVIAFYTGEG